MSSSPPDTTASETPSPPAYTSRWLTRQAQIYTGIFAAVTIPLVFVFGKYFFVLEPAIQEKMTSYALYSFVPLVFMTYLALHFIMLPARRFLDLHNAGAPIPPDILERTSKTLERMGIIAVGLALGAAGSSIAMGLAMDSPGYNLFLCGLSGTSKMALIEEYVRSFRRPKTVVPDRCYAQNFHDPRRPLLLEVPAGHGQRLQADIHSLLHALHSGLEKLPERRWRAKAREILSSRLPRLLEQYPHPMVAKWLRRWRKVLLESIRHGIINN